MCGRKQQFGPVHFNLEDFSILFNFSPIDITPCKEFECQTILVKHMKPVSMNGWEYASCMWDGAEESSTQRLGAVLAVLWQQGPVLRELTICFVGRTKS